MWNVLSPDTGEPGTSTNDDDTKIMLAQRFLEDGKFAEKLNSSDDGSVLWDHRLLHKLMDMEMKRETRAEQDVITGLPV